MDVGASIARLLSVLPLAVVLLACGGRVSGADAGTSGTEGSERDSGRGSTDPDLPCPLLPPAAGLSCSYPPGEVCVYVGGGQACQAFQCNDSGQWVAANTGC